MQHDGIRLQQAGKKIGQGHPARRDDDRPDEVNREPRQTRERKFKYAERVMTRKLPR
jgi:hypothetical protein